MKPGPSWAWFGLALFAGTLAHLAAQSNMVLYADSVQNGWNNWSWGSTINFSYHSSSQYIHSGSDSMAMTITNGWAGLYLEHADFDSTPYTNITFWVNGGPAGGQPLAVKATLGGSVTGSQYNFTAAANAWQQITVPLSSVGAAEQGNFDGIYVQSQSPSALPVFYLDDMSLTGGGTPSTNASVTITVNAQLDRHPISPQIYGVAFASSNQLSDLNFTMNRSGGNEETTYNWLINAHGKGADWYFESYPDSSGTPGATADSFVANSKAGGGQAMVTIPMIGWAPMLGAGRTILYSYAVSKYGPQTSVDPSLTNAGDGTGTNASTGATWLITTNNPNDANFPTNTAFEQAYVQHLLGNWGSSTNGGVGYYLMDNEPSIWFSTHQDVHPGGPTMQEIWTNILSTASMVKSNDPNALVLGPEEWGWSGYFYSGYDQQWAGQHGDYDPADYPDRAANGGWDYVPWLLNQCYQYQATTGRRLLDYLTLHCYPQEGDVGSDSDISTATELLRNATTRQFWDTNYVDPSWINSVIMLIPRMKQWVSTYYPGTKIGVTEYNWGAEGYINGGTAEADLLGIFGWQGLDLATRWEVPATGTPTYNAMKMYRNYDGRKSTFGDTSVSATGTDPDDISVFAATRSPDGALTAMVINKQLTGFQPFTLLLSGFDPSGNAEVWQLDSANTINQPGNLAVTAGSLSTTVPAQSITLLVLPRLAAPAAPALAGAAVASPGTFSFTLEGQAGLSYFILWSTNLATPLATWTVASTNTLAGGATNLTLPATGSVRFYRAQWAGY